MDKCAWTASCGNNTETCDAQVLSTHQCLSPKLDEVEKDRCPFAGRCGIYTSACTTKEMPHCAGMVPMTDYSRQELIKYGQKKYAAIKFETGQCCVCQKVGEVFFAESHFACFSCFQSYLIPLWERFGYLQHKKNGFLNSLKIFLKETAIKQTVKIVEPIEKCEYIATVQPTEELPENICKKINDALAALNVLPYNSMALKVKRRIIKETLGYVVSEGDIFKHMKYVFQIPTYPGLKEFLTARIKRDGLISGSTESR